MHLAIVSGQPFSHLLLWHPRDVDTLQEHYEEQADRAAEQRLDAMRAEINKGR